MSEPKSAWIVNVTDADFERQVIEQSRERPVVVDFWAEWCQPCRMLGPILEQLIEERKGAVILAKVDIDEAQQSAARHGVQVVPTVRAFRDGEAVLGFEGVLREEQLRQFLDRIIPTEADKLTHEAAAAEAERPAEAETLYRSALEQDARHPAALVGLARVLLARGDESQATDLLGRLGLGSGQEAEVERLNQLLALREVARELGDEATVRQRLQAEPGNAERRYEMGCVLAAAGKYPEALEQLLSAAEADPKLGGSKVREVMVKIFQIIGVRSPLADESRDRLTRLLY